MHMSDALISPAIGGTFWIASGAVVAYSAAQLKRDGNEHQVPLMGVLGAFVFAAQMINFAIPGTGSSGHIGGGMLLAMLLSPPAAYIVMVSVLTVQCLFFADGGLLALGTSIFNIGFFACFPGYLIYRTIVRPNPGKKPSPVRLTIGAIAGTIIALELGAMGVVLQTLLSGRSDIPFGPFAALMAGIHLPIALVEGILTAAVVNFVFQIRPEMLQKSIDPSQPPAQHRLIAMPKGTLTVAMAGLAILIGCFISWFASSKPDGLEYSLAKAGWEKRESPDSLSKSMARMQERIAPMPDYAFAANTSKEASVGNAKIARAETSMAGFTGTILVVVLVGCISGLLYLVRGRRKTAAPSHL